MTTADAQALVYRVARPEDTNAIEALDGSFTTASVFRVTVSEEGFALLEVPVDPPLHKAFPDDGPDEEDADGDDENSLTYVAVDVNGLAGFVALSYAPWNRRLTIEDIEVAPAHRRRGVGRTLMGHALDFARERGAGHLWLEVTNINTPAIHAYRHMGFSFCGLDTSLYEDTPSTGEQALYMSMPCP